MIVKIIFGLVSTSTSYVLCRFEAVGKLNRFLHILLTWVYVWYSEAACTCVQSCTPVLYISTHQIWRENGLVFVGTILISGGGGIKVKTL